MAERNELLELLRFSGKGYSISEIPEELEKQGLSRSELTLQLIQGLSSSSVVEEHSYQLRLSDRELSGW